MFSVWCRVRPAVGGTRSSFRIGVSVSEPPRPLTPCGTGLRHAPLPKDTANPEDNQLTPRIAPKFGRNLRGNFRGRTGLVHLDPANALVPTKPGELPLGI